MTKYKGLLFTVTLALCLLLVMPAGAEEAKKKDDSFSGYFTVGYRGVDVDGVEYKYKEDYNLDDGPRLFNFKFRFNPNGTMKKYFDEMEIALRNFGGEPFETFDIRIAKYGTYTFKFERRKSEYFYHDIFAGHDLHTFDFERISDSLFLKVWVTNNAHLYFSFDRYTKKGESTTSLDISRDEFEFDAPVDQTSKEFAIGFDLAVKGFTLFFEERIQDFTNDYRYFLPGFSEGEDPGDLSTLSLFFFNQPYDFRSFYHTGRIMFRPNDKLIVKAAARISNQDLRLSYTEMQDGIAYTGSPFSYTYSGEGNFDRDIQLYQFDLSYLFTNQVAFTGSVRFHKLEQEGIFDVYGVEMPHAMDFETLGIEAGLQYQPNGKVGVTAGFRSESRDVTLEEHGEPELQNTKQTGLFLNVKMTPNKKLNLTGDYQYGSYDDAFTAISPTDYHRARFTARYKTGKFYLNGTYLYQLSENDIDDGWTSERSELGLRAGFYNAKVKFSLGYSMIYSKLEGDRNFVFFGRPATWNIFYEGRANLFDASIYLNASKNVKLGAYANYYQNDGSWEIERLILRPFLEVKLPHGLFGQLAYRYIDFKENLEHLNDYSASIFEVSFGYRW